MGARPRKIEAKSRIIAGYMSEGLFAGERNMVAAPRSEVCDARFPSVVVTFPYKGDAGEQFRPLTVGWTKRIVRVRRHVSHAPPASHIHPERLGGLVMEFMHSDRPVKTFGVVRLADVWVLTAHGKRVRRFSYRVDAEEAAIRLAADASAQGHPVEVVVQGKQGELTRLHLVGACGALGMA